MHTRWGRDGRGAGWRGRDGAGGRCFCSKWSLQVDALIVPVFDALYPADPEGRAWSFAFLQFRK